MLSCNAIPASWPGPVPTPPPKPNLRMSASSNTFQDLTTDLLALQSRTTVTTRDLYQQQLRERKQAQHASESTSTSSAHIQQHSNPNQRKDYAQLQRELLQPSKTDLSKDINYGIGTNEARLDEKADLTNDMASMTQRLLSTVTNISSTLESEKATLNFIEQNLDTTQASLVGINERLKGIVGGAWWDFFSNLAMFTLVMLVSAFVFGVIMTIPKAKWL